MERWRTAANGENVTFEIRWKQKPNNQLCNDNSKDLLWTWVACIPVRSDHSEVVTGIFGCSIDISAQKDATSTALRRVEAERRLASFTELSPLGFYQLDANLKMTYCNDQWFKITEHPKRPLDQIDWRLVVNAEDLDGIYRDLEVISRNRGPHTFSLRLRKPWVGPDGVTMPTWLQSTANTHVDGDGVMTSIVGTMTDISQLKWAEAVQKSRADQILESKRQQENCTYRLSATCA